MRYPETYIPVIDWCIVYVVAPSGGVKVLPPHINASRCLGLFVG